MLQNPVKGYTMHITIDARMYGVAQRGIGRYLMKLIEQLEVMDKENTYTLFLRLENFEEYTPRNPNFKKMLWDVPWYGWREQVTFRTLLEIRGRASDPTEARPPDIVHFPHWNVPLLFRQPFVVTIHDLELFSSNRTREASTRGRMTYWLKHLVFRIVFRHAVLAARAIIVPSNVVREQLLDLYPQVRKKVRVIYEAPTLTVTSPPVADVTGSNYAKQVTNYVSEASKLPERYALYVGAAYPHKNLPRLLEAWQIVHKQLPEYKLVLVGREDYFWKKLKTTSYVLRPTSSIIFYGSATDEELAALYQNAALLVQPSLEEGFSLPPLEALSFECPVAVSDIPIHREILGDTAVFFDPKDTAAMAEIIKNALIGRDISAQAASRAKTLLLKYSWPTHARQTLDLYRTIASQNQGNGVK